MVLSENTCPIGPFPTNLPKVPFPAIFRAEGTYFISSKVNELKPADVMPAVNVGCNLSGNLLKFVFLLKPIDPKIAKFAPLK